jgi:hypothetical protein
MTTQQFTIILNAIGANQVSGEIGKIMTAFRGLLPALAGVATVGMAIRGMTHNLNDAIKTADDLGKSAQRMGTAVKELSTLSLAAKLSDTSVQEMSRSVKTLSAQVIEAINPTSDAARRFAELGIEVMNSNGALQSSDQILMQLADRFAAMPDGITKVRLANELLGKSGENLIPLLNQGSEAIRKTQEEARIFGLEVGPTFAKNAEHFRDNMTRIGAIFNGLWMQVANALLPELIKLTDWFVQFVKDTGVHMGIVGTMIDLYKEFAKAVTALHFALTAQGALLATFFGNLSVTGNPIKALTAAMDDLDERFAKYEQRIDEINQIGSTSSGAGAGNVSEGEYEQRQIKLAAYRERIRDIEATIAYRDLWMADLKADRMITESERTKKMNALLSEQLDLITKKGRIESQALEDGLVTPEDFRKGSLGDLNDAAGKRGQIEANPSSVVEQMRVAMIDLQNQFGTVAQQIAKTFTDTIGAAIQSISAGITDVIMGTLTWGQALANISRTIVATLIQSIIQMGVQWVLTHVIMKGVSVAFHAVLEALGWARVASSNAQEAAKMPALATNAALASVGSYGTAAIIGAVALVAAIGVGIAAAAGAFAEGGRPPVNRLALVGERGPELFVPDTAGTIIPADVTSSLLSGGAAPAGKQNLDVRVAVTDERRARDLENDPAFEGIVLRIFEKNRWRYS